MMYYILKDVLVYAGLALPRLRHDLLVVVIGRLRRGGAQVRLGRLRGARVALRVQLAQPAGREVEGVLCYIIWHDMT